MKKQKSIEPTLATDHLRAAEKHLEIAIGKIGKHAGSGPPKSYIGSLREYRTLVKLYLRLRGVTEQLAHGEKRMMLLDRQEAMVCRLTGKQDPALQ